MSARRPCAQLRRAASCPFMARASVAAPLRPRPSSAGRHIRARTGKTREEPPCTEAQCHRLRWRPVVVPSRRRHAKKERYVLKNSSRPSPNHSACRRPCPPLPSSPGRSAISQRRWRAATVLPRRVIFVAQKSGTGKNTILYLFYVSFLIRLLTVQLVVSLSSSFVLSGCRM